MYRDTYVSFRLCNFATSRWYCFSTNTLWTIVIISSGVGGERLVLRFGSIDDLNIVSSLSSIFYSFHLWKYPLCILPANEFVSCNLIWKSFIDALTPELTLYYGLDSFQQVKAYYLIRSRAYVIYLPYCFSLYIGSYCFSIVNIISGLFSWNFFGWNSILQVPIALVYLDTSGKWLSRRSSVAMTYVFAQESVLGHTWMIRVH